MATSEELAILIRAQQQTQAAFDGARKDLAGLRQESQQANQTLGLLKGGLGALGIAFSATAVIGFAKDIVDTAGNIGDLSQALKISTDAVQDFKLGAETSGATIDDVGRAINRLNVEAGNGADGFEKLGLPLAKIQAMSPEERFRAVADALKGIEDPAVRAALGQELLGKGYENLAAAIDDGIGSMHDANKMSEDTIKTLKWLGDTLVEVGIKAKNFGGEVLAAAVNTPRDTWRRMNDDLEQLGISIEDVAAKAPGIPKAFDGLGKTQVAINATDKELAEANKTLDAQRKVLDEAAQKAKQHAEAIAKLRDELTGRGAIRAALEMTEALRGSLPILKLSEESQNKINKQMGEAIDAYLRFGQTVPPAVQAAFIATTHLEAATAGLTGEFQNVGVKLEQFTIPKMADFSYHLDYIAGIPFGVKVGQQVDIVPPKIAKTRDELGLLGQSLAQLSQIAGGAFGGIAQGFATMISAADTAKRSFDNIRSVDWKNGSTWEGILSTTTGILGIASAAITAVKAIAGLFDRNKGRDLVVDFAANLGGFDALHNALLQGGDAGEQLWIKLTQGVGRNNPDQAKQVIAEVQKFLDDLGKTVVEPQINPQVNWPNDMPGGEDNPPPEEGEGFRSGTPNLDFVNFGRASRVTLHRDEAVVPRSRVGTLAGQIAAALVPQQAAMAGGGDFYITLDMGDMGKQVVKIARKDAARGGVRTRAASGRVF